MGGSLGRGNYGVLSEFNFAADPEAAKIVFDSGLPIQVAPMEVGRQAKVMPEISEKDQTAWENWRYVLSIILKISWRKFCDWIKYV